MKPPVFSGDESTWSDWSFKLRSYVSVIQPSGVQAFTILARRYNPRSQARSLAQLQEIMHFDFGQEPAGVTDRMIVFERLIGEFETSSGEALGVQVQCAVLLERVPPELRTHLLLTCGPRLDDAIMRRTVGSSSVARRSWQTNRNRRCVWRRR